MCELVEADVMGIPDDVPGEAATVFLVPRTKTP